MNGSLPRRWSGPVGSRWRARWPGDSGPRPGATGGWRSRPTSPSPATRAPSRSATPPPSPGARPERCRPDLPAARPGGHPVGPPRRPSDPPPHRRPPTAAVPLPGQGDHGHHRSPGGHHPVPRGAPWCEARSAGWPGSGLHLVYLIGFRNRIVVLVNWSWRYLSWGSGPRVIVDDELETGPRPEPAARRTTSRRRTEGSARGRIAGQRYGERGGRRPRPDRPHDAPAVRSGRGVGGRRHPCAAVRRPRGGPGAGRPRRGGRHPLPRHRGADPAPAHPSGRGDQLLPGPALPGHGDPDAARPRAQRRPGRARGPSGRPGLG